MIKNFDVYRDINMVFILSTSSIKPFGLYGIWSRDQPDWHPKIASYLLITERYRAARYDELYYVEPWYINFCSLCMYFCTYTFLFAVTSITLAIFTVTLCSGKFPKQLMKSNISIKIPSRHLLWIYLILSLLKLRIWYSCILHATMSIPNRTCRLKILIKNFFSFLISLYISNSRKV